MARPTPIIVPGPSGMGSQQTDVGIDLGSILGFFKEKKEAEEAKTREESITNFLVEQLVPPTPRAVGGGVSTIPGLNIPQQAEVGASPQQRSFIQSLVGQDPAKATELARGMAFPESVADTTRQFAKQVETKYIPTGEDDKFQLNTVDRVTGEATPVLKNGKTIELTEKQVLIAEGKKAQSLIDPFETKFLSKLGETEGARLTELKKSAVDSVSSKKIISEGRALLDQGVYTGSAANIKKSLDKWLQEANINIGGRKAANTEAYASMMGLQVGKIIKQFGSGTGLSDADREYAESIVGGRVTLTEDAIRRLLDINDRLADFSITEYNSQAKRAKEDLESKDFLRPIEIPSFGAPTTVKSIETMTEEELDAEIQRLEDGE